MERKIKSIMGLLDFPNRIPGIEAYLEEQAEKGWFLDEFYASSGAVFTRGKPRKCKYYVTYAAVQPELYREGEWKYIGTFGKAAVLESDTGERPPEGSSERLQYESAKYAIWTRIMPLAWLGVLLMAFCLWLDLRSALWGTGMAGLRIALEILVFLPLCMIAVGESLWIIRNNRRMKRGQDILWGLTKPGSVLLWAWELPFIAFVVGNGMINGMVKGERLYSLIWFVFILLLPAANLVFMEIFEGRRRRKGEGGSADWTGARLAFMIIMIVICLIILAAARRF